MTSFAYDALDRRTRLTDPVGNQTTWTRDALGRILTETNQAGAVRSYTYDASGNITRTVDRNGEVIEYGYDALDRPVLERWLDGTTAVKIVALTYDVASRLTSVADDVSAYAFAYDAAGRLTSVSNAGTPGVPTVVLSYSYDAAGRVTGLSAVVDGVADFANTYQYDALGRVTRVVQAGVAGGRPVAAKRVDFAYNAIGAYATIARFADAGAQHPVAASIYTYDAAHRLVGLSHAQGITTLASYGWAYDAAGRLTHATSVDGATTYAYDATNQLTAADHSYQADESYTYDANGNRAMAGHATGVANRLLSDGTYTYAYDAEGRRTRRTEIATGAYTDYAWDRRGRLTAVTHRDASGAMTRRVTYTYDALDRRIGKAVDTNGDGTDDQVTRFVHDGAGGLGWTDDVVLTFDGSGALRQRMLHGPAVDQALAVEDGSGSVRWYLADHQGTVRDVVAHDAGTGVSTVVNHLRYDSFGRIASQTAPAEAPAYAFTGREWDGDAGLYYYRARWYDPIVGRFVSEDPLGSNAGDANTQRYVGNSPQNDNDPTGLIGENFHEKLLRLAKERLEADKAPEKPRQPPRPMPPEYGREPTQSQPRPPKPDTSKWWDKYLKPERYVKAVKQGIEKIKGIGGGPLIIIFDPMLEFRLKVLQGGPAMA